MENIWFSMFNFKSKLIEKSRNNVITTKKMYVWFFIAFFLGNKETICYLWMTEWKKTEIFSKRLLDLFSKMWKIRVI